MSGFSRGVGAGLFNLFVLFGFIGEPAPTGLLDKIEFPNFPILKLSAFICVCLP
jgi:hypothetical protein